MPERLRGAFIPLINLTDAEKEWIENHRTNDLARQFIMVMSKLNETPHIAHGRREWNRLVKDWRQTRSPLDWSVRREGERRR
jgi:hypothetical protein